jgi:NAD+ synthase (glutamine-hydrolysing)
MKIALAQLNFHIGNFKGNTEKMVNAVRKAKEDGADLICFPELATCGYPPRDFLEFDDFIVLAERSVDELAAESHGIGIIVGSPSHNPRIEGKDLFNTAYFLYNGEILAKQHKALLPTYDIFDEYRYFEPANEFQTVEFKGKRIAMTVCEDIWNVGNQNPMYTICPLDEVMDEKPDLIINISASPFSYDQASTRIHVVRENTLRYNTPLFYVNHIGAQTELIFDGGSLVMSPDGKVYDEMPYFKEEVSIYDLGEVNESGGPGVREKDELQLIHDALVLGVKDYFGKLGFRKAILGLSGGIDSALTAVILCNALGAEHVTGLLMPSQFSSDHSIEDARQLAINLGMNHELIGIEDIYQKYTDTLQPFFKGMPFNVTEENIQARIRGMLLMAFSNKLGNILVNTTNKSEMAVGYGTLYGDLCGGLSVIGDVYKTEVFELARWINRNGELIPENTITKPPSAELRPDQKDSDTLPEYDILDQILYQYIEERKDPADIIASGFDEMVVKKALRLVNMNEFKRYQTAPVLRVSPKAFGIGRRVPIVGKYLI